MVEIHAKRQMTYYRYNALLRISVFHRVRPREMRFSIRQTILPMLRHRFEKQSMTKRMRRKTLVKIYLH